MSFFPNFTNFISMFLNYYELIITCLIINDLNSRRVKLKIIWLSKSDVRLKIDQFYLFAYSYPRKNIIQENMLAGEYVGGVISINVKSDKPYKNLSLKLKRDYSDRWTTGSGKNKHTYVKKIIFTVIN
jgi:hypothetical protein